MASQNMFPHTSDENAEPTTQHLEEEFEGWNPYEEDMAYCIFPDQDSDKEANFDDIVTDTFDENKYERRRLRAIRKGSEFDVADAYIMKFDMYTQGNLHDNIASKFVITMLESKDNNSLECYLEDLSAHGNYYEDFKGLDSIYYLEGDYMLQRYFAYAIVNALPDELLEHFVSAGAIVSNEQLYFTLMMVRMHLHTEVLGEECQYLRVARFLINHGVSPDSGKMYEFLKYSYEIRSPEYCNYKYYDPEHRAKSERRFRNAEQYNIMSHDIIYDLCVSSNDKYFDLVKLLVESGYKLNADLYDYPLVTLCVLACEDDKRIEYLVEHGAFIHVSNRERRLVNNYPHSPLIAAFFENRTRLADYFMSKGLDINWRFPKNHPVDEYPLYVAIKKKLYKYNECINAMAIRGVDITALDRNGYNVFDIYIHKVYDGPYRQRIIPKGLKVVMNIYIHAAQRIKHAFKVEMQSPEYIYGRIKRLEDYLDLFPDCHDIHPDVISALSTWKSLPYHSRERLDARKTLFALVATHQPFTPKI